MSKINQIKIILIITCLFTSSCAYSKKFGIFYKHQMAEVDNNHGKVSALAIKTVESPFYGFLYLYGGLGFYLDSTTKNHNKLPMQNKEK